MDRVRRLSLLSQEHMFFIVGEHEEILARLKAHDVKGADESITVHLISVMRELDVIRAATRNTFRTLVDGFHETLNLRRFCRARTSCATAFSGGLNR